MKYEEDVDGIMIVVVSLILLVVLLFTFTSSTDSVNEFCKCNEKMCDTCGKVVAE